MGLAQRSITLTDRQWSIVRATAKEYGISLPEALRRMLDEYFEIKLRPKSVRS